MARLDVVAGEGKTGGGWGLADRGEALRTGGGAPTGGAAGAGWWGGECGFAAGADLWGRFAPGVVLLQERGFAVGAPPSVRRGVSEPAVLHFHAGLVAG